MPLDVQELLEGVAILADNHNIRVTVKQSAKGALACGACCFIGGLIAGLSLIYSFHISFASMKLTNADFLSTSQVHLD